MERNNDLRSSRSPWWRHLVSAQIMMVMLCVLPAQGSNRLVAWGDNQNAELGVGTSGPGSFIYLPTPVIEYGALAGREVTALSAGAQFSLAVASDGTAYGWGLNQYGQLGNGTKDTSGVPVAVYNKGVLAGKTIRSIAAGGAFSLALATDGTVYAWGNNQNGTLGNGGNMDSSVPIAVYMGGVLAGKSVKAIAAGGSHCLALTTDGAVYSWGYNSNGQLGVGGTGGFSNVPAAVVTAGTPMAGKTIVGIAAGGYHSLALASDGTVYAWGWNLYGQLGNGVSGSVGSNLPVAVTTAGTPMAGKTITAVAAGFIHSVVLSSEGTVFTWGSNSSGQLGIGSSGPNSLSGVPVAVATAGTPMAGKVIADIRAGDGDTLALASDGSAYAWGTGALGNGSTTSNAPVAVNLSSGVATAAGGDHALALVSDGPGWQALDVSEGSDNKSRLLWVNASGQVVVWSVDSSGTVSSGPIYGPYVGWTPRALGACR